MIALADSKDFELVTRGAEAARQPSLASIR